MNEFANKVAVITGGANGIGKCIAGEFRKQGAAVCVIDKADGRLPVHPGFHFPVDQPRPQESFIRPDGYGIVRKA